MLIAYSCGALATALAAMVGANRVSGRTDNRATQIAVTVLAGAFWPVVAVGVLQAIGVVLLANTMKTATVADVDAHTSDLVLAG